MPKTTREVEIPPHVQAAVNFVFGLHGKRFLATKSFQRGQPLIRLRLHNPVATEQAAIMTAMLPLRAHPQLRIREVNRGPTLARAHLIIYLQKADRGALTAAWNAKRAASEV